MAYQPGLYTNVRCNTAEVDTFEIVIQFGTTSIAKVFGKDVLVARNSPGKYTITLPQTYRKLCGFDGIAQIASGTTLFPVIAADNSGTALGTAAQGVFKDGGQITLEMRTAAGVATDPTSGDKVSLTLSLSKNFLNDKYEA